MILLRYLYWQSICSNFCTWS